MLQSEKLRRVQGVTERFPWWEGGGKSCVTPLDFAQPSPLGFDHRLSLESRASRVTLRTKLLY